MQENLISVGAKDILIRELKDSLNEQRELNKTLQLALNISNIQVQELTVQVKYVNEMPLYRQEKDWLQYGFELSRATMANWVIECTNKYLRVLYEFYHRLLLSRGFAMAYESPIQVLKEEGHEATAKSYVIGRKGWLFSDSPEGAEASAISYSIAETALANGLNVYKYITYVLEKRPTEEMADSELEKLLPWNDKVFEMCKIER